MLTLSWQGFYGDFLVDGKERWEFPNGIMEGTEVSLGEPHFDKPSFQPWGDRFAYAELPPAEQYVIDVTYELYTWNSYVPPYGAGQDADSTSVFSLSLLDTNPLSFASPGTNYGRLGGPFHQNPLDFNGLGISWGGGNARSGTLASVREEETLVFSGSNSPQYLVLASTFDSPGIKLGGVPFTYPAWGTFKISLRDLAAGELFRQENGTLDYSYTVSGEPFPRAEIGFYWATGDQVTDILGGIDKPFHRDVLNTVEEMSPGVHQGRANYAAGYGRPQEATHVLMVMDWQQSLDEVYRRNNTASLPVADVLPLKIDVLGGGFREQYLPERDLYAHVSYPDPARLLIGLAPAAGRSFRPDVELVGSAWYSRAWVHLEGTFYQLDSARNRTSQLFTGEVWIPKGKGASTRVLEEPGGGNQYAVAGSPLDVTGLRFGEEEVGLQGKVLLSQPAGDGLLPLDGDNWLVLSDSGVAMSGFEIPLRDFSISLDGDEDPDFIAKDMSVGYVPADEEEVEKFVIHGHASIPKWGGLSADFTGDNYIQYSAGEWDMKGRLAAGPITFVEDKWVLEEAYLEFDSSEGTAKGGGKMRTPLGVELGGSLGMVNWELDSMEATGGGGLPIFSTGYQLTEATGKVEHLASSDEEPVSLTGSVTIESLAKTTLDKSGGALGDWLWETLGAPADASQIEATLHQFEVTATVDENHLTGKGTLYFPAITIGDGDPTALIKVGGEMEFNWEKRFFKGNGTVTLLGDLVTVEGRFFINGDGDVVIEGSGALRMPTIEGTEFQGQQFEGSVNVQYVNDGDPTNDYIRVGGEIPNDEQPELTVKFGLWLDFQGNIHGVHEEPPPEPEADSALQDSKASAAEGGTLVSSSPDKALLWVSWTNDMGTRAIEVVAPDGTVYSEAQIRADPEMALIDRLATATSKTVVIRNPATGAWRIRPVDVTGLGPVSAGRLNTNHPPSLEIIEQIVDPYTNDDKILYRASDPDSPFQVDFFLDTDSSGNDGIPFRGYAFPYAGIYTATLPIEPPGTYWVYASITDGYNAPQVVYAPSPMTIENSPPYVFPPQDYDAFLDVGETLRLEFEGRDRNLGASVIFNLGDGAPAGAEITPDGRLTLSPDPRRLGSYDLFIPVEITDGQPLSLGPNRSSYDLFVRVAGPQAAAGAIQTPGQSDLWRIQATAGQELVFVPSNIPGEALVVTIRGPTGAVLHQGPAHVPQRVAFSESGLQTVTITGAADAGTGAYQFHFREVAEIGRLLEDLRSATDFDEFEFQGTAGQVVFLDLTAYRQGELIAPGGGSRTVKSSADGGGLLALDQTGRYVLRLEGVNSGRPYSVLLRDVADAVPLTPAQPVELDLQLERGLFLLSYAGTAGEAIEFTGGTGLLFFDAEGNHIELEYGVRRVYLPQTGDYLIALIEQGVRRFEVVLETSSPPTQALVYGQAYTDTTARSGIDEFTFTGTAGQWLYFEKLGQDSARVDLVGVDGQVRHWNSEQVVRLEQTGAYRLAITRWGEARSFRLTEVTGLAELPLETYLDDQLAGIPGKLNVYRYSGTQGEEIRVATRVPNSGTAWTLYDPWGAVIAAGNDGLAAYLQAGGDYFLVARGIGVGPIDYEFKLTRNAVVSQPLSLGSRVSAVVSPGQHHRFVFGGTAGQRLLLNSNDWRGTATVTLFGPDGTELHRQLANRRFPVLDLPASGEYTLLIGAPASGGYYDLTAIDVDGQAAVFEPQTLQGTLATQHDEQWYAFSAKAGDTFAAADNLPVGSGGMKTLLNADFEALAHAPFGRPISVALPNAGTYFLSLQGSVWGATPYQLSLQLGPDVNQPPTANADNVRIAPGEAVVIDVLNNDLDPEWQPISAVLLAGPSHGTLDLQPDGFFLYQAQGGYVGLDQFSYRATDGVMDSNAVTVTITVTAAIWQNPLHPYDVNADGQTSPIDVLTLINDINSSGSRGLVPLISPSPPPYLDPSGDGQITPNDVLVVVNYLNLSGAGLISSASAGEGESGFIFHRNQRPAETGGDTADNGDKLKLEPGVVAEVKWRSPGSRVRWPASMQRDSTTTSKESGRRPHGESTSYELDADELEEAVSAIAHRRVLQANPARWPGAS